MTIPRKLQISLDHTAWYHCTTRCVRRAFLCGKDHYTGKSYEHRKVWLESRLSALSDIFAIDVGAYALMSNHYHLVVRIDAERSKRWSDDQVLERWGQIFKTNGNESQERIDILRIRLANLSWYMRCINEPLARYANREDGCKGRFWEGRFRCQALLDESAVIRCMTYVDLNPIRADIASTPETSAHTTIKARIEGRDADLLRFADQGGPIPFRSLDYLDLVDWTGRQMRHGKKGRITGNPPPILERLGYSADGWQREMTHYGSWYARAVGSLVSLEQYCQQLGLCWLKGFGYCRKQEFSKA